jgi:tetratricopeptide (TPR) repeat protein
MKPASRVAVALVLLASLAVPAAAQERLPTPWASPASTVSQTVGVTEITVTAGRPAVKGRTIWGDVVPYGEVWRAGANENTTVCFEHDVTIEGQALAAGTYGVHVIPEQDRWTVIFSRNATSWGSYSYDAKEDALRVEVTPAAAPFTEWLTWEFDDLATGSATLRLRWEKLAVNLKLSVDTPAIVLDHARNVYLRGIPGFLWEGWNSAAAYCLANKVNLEEGLAWAQRSVGLQANFTNLWTQGGLLAALGRTDEAARVKDKAMALAGEAELNALGYQFLQTGKLEDALAIFRRNAELHADSWNVHDSLAEAYAVKGEKALAIENYGKALSMTQDPTQKQRIEGELKKLGAQ